MRKILVVVLVLSWCLKLSASVTVNITAHQTDSVKVVPVKKHKRLPKQSVAIKTDSLKAAIPAFHTDDLKAPAAVSGTDSLKQAQLLHQDSLIVAQSLADSLKTLQILKSTDTLKRSGFIHKDSLIVTHPDSVRSLPPVEHTDTIKAVSQTAIKSPLAPANYYNTPVFYVSVDHYDGPMPSYAITYVDTIKQRVTARTTTAGKSHVRLHGVDSLAQQIRLIPSDSLRAGMYTQIAAMYLKYDTISNPEKQLSYQDHALAYTLKAIHFYSRGNDTLGLRTCFNNLERVYFDQGKYAEAKWFILQSNTISRQRRDVPNIITSLITLADIKGTIKDYQLAMRDLDEAIRLSELHHYAKIELAVFNGYAILYSRMNNYPKEAEYLKKRDSLDLSIQKSEKDSLLAAVAARDLQQKKKADSLLVKKKVYTSNIARPYKSNSTKKIDTL